MFQDWLLSSPGGAGFMNDRQPMGDRPVGCETSTPCGAGQPGDLHFRTPRVGDYRPGSIFFVPDWSESYICRRVMIQGLDGIVPR